MFKSLFGNKMDTTRIISRADIQENQLCYSDILLQTLGSENSLDCVQIPPDCNKNKWIFTNVLEFYNEVCLIWSIITDEDSCDYLEKYREKGSGFPSGFEYRWANEKRRAPIVCSAPEYIEFCLDWMRELLNIIEVEGKY